MINESEFEAIINQTKGTVLSATNRFLNPRLRYLIDDVAQEVYFALYKRFRKQPLFTLDSLKDYVYTATKNECIRINKKESKLKTEEFQTDPVAPESENPLQDMYEIIEQMPSPSQIPIRLFLDGFSLNEISKKLNLNLNTVKSILCRSRNALIKKYKAELI